MRICPTCLEDKVIVEPCPRCKGEGLLRKKRFFRKGMKLVDCTNRKCVWGTLIKLCPTCRGLGQVP